MRNQSDVLAHVVNGHGPKLAEILEVSVSRCYEILSTDNPLPKAKRLIRAIAQVNPEGIRLIKADLDAMFHDLLHDLDGDACISEFHHETSEATQAVLTDKPKPVQRKEMLDVIAVAAKHIRTLDESNGNRAVSDEVRKIGAAAVAKRRQG